MALRTSPTLLGTWIRAGVLCLAPTGRTCVAHGLPETPDTFSFIPLASTGNACGASWFLESWDATSVIFVNCFTGVAGYVRIAVEYRQIQ